MVMPITAPHTLAQSNSFLLLVLVLLLFPFPLGFASSSFSQFEQALAQAAAGFALTGLPAGYLRAYYMTEYKRCDGREKVNGRHVYEGTRASGGGKLYCWYKDGAWRFSDVAEDIGTNMCDLYVIDGAAAPDQTKSTSTWRAYVNGEWEVVTGMKVQALWAHCTGTTRHRP